MKKDDDDDDDDHSTVIGVERIKNENKYSTSE